MGTLLTCLAPESPSAREDRLGREAVYRATMAGHYSASTHSFERWIDLSVRPPATPRCLRRKPVPEAAYGALVFGDGRTAAAAGAVGAAVGGRGGASLLSAVRPSGELGSGEIPLGARPLGVLPSAVLPSAVLPSVVLPAVELPSVVLPPANLPMVAGARGNRADSGLYTGEMHRGILYRSLSPTGSARPISRILGDVRVRNVVSVKSVVGKRKGAAAK